MKTLQNDFTTPEQSKRLLELGVPAESANCYYTEILWHRPRFITEDTIPNWNARLMDGTQKYLPCWSAGRLMEIYGIGMGVEGFFYCKGNFIDEAIRRIEGSVKDNLIDFSKLEEFMKRSNVELNDEE